jgi:uncharacterized protein (UPF0333 family)
VAPPPARRRRGLLIAVFAVVLVVLIAGGGGVGYFLTRNTDKGQSTPTAAIVGFLTAVYTHTDAKQAAKYVCPDARDTAKLAAKVNQVTAQNARYESPTYAWTTPSTLRTTASEATLTTTLTLSTEREQYASQHLQFLTTKQNGWWVCEVQLAR